LHFGGGGGEGLDAASNVVEQFTTWSGVLEESCRKLSQAQNQSTFDDLTGLIDQWNKLPRTSDGSLDSEALSELTEHFKLLIGLARNLLELSKIESAEQRSLIHITVECCELLEALFKDLRALGGAELTRIGCTLVATAVGLHKYEEINLEKLFNLANSAVTYLSEALLYDPKGKSSSVLVSHLIAILGLRAELWPSVQSDLSEEEKRQRSAHDEQRIDDLLDKHLKAYRDHT